MKPFTDIFQEFDQIYSCNIYVIAIFKNSYSDRALSVTASGSTKVFKLSPKNLETYLFSRKIRLTIDKFSKKQIEKRSFVFSHMKYDF